MRIGQATDIHKLVENRPLILGGVEISFEKGLLGHSDADVLTHAVTESIIGALGRGDLGSHFPDTDPAYEGISSLILLERIWEMMDEMGYQVGNIDATVMIESWPPIRSRWRKTSRPFCVAIPNGSTSRRPEAKGSALWAGAKAFRPSASACWKRKENQRLRAFFFRRLTGTAYNEFRRINEKIMRGERYETGKEGSAVTGQLLCNYISFNWTVSIVQDGFTVFDLQSGVFDAILPNAMKLLLTLGVYWAIKKGKNAMHVTLGVMAIGLVLGLLGLAG